MSTPAQQEFLQCFKVTPDVYMRNVLSAAAAHPVPPQPRTIMTILRDYRKRIDSMNISWSLDGRSTLKAMFAKKYGQTCLEEWMQVIDMFASMTIMTAEKK